MKLGFLLSTTDTGSAIWISPNLTARLSTLISQHGFDEGKRATAQKGLDMTIWLDSLRGSVLSGQRGIVASPADADVFVYSRASKPAGCD